MEKGVGLAEWRVSEGHTLHATVAARIIGCHANYLTALWAKGGAHRERVKVALTEAEAKFESICHKKAI